jgi:flagellar FliJ protein
MAKRFVFRLETLLKLRRQREDRQKRVVAERLRQIARVRNEIGLLERQIAEQVGAMRIDAGRPSLDVQSLARGRHWLSHLQRGRLDADGHLRLLETRLAQERAVLAHAAKEKKVLEKLKERQRLRYATELGRREQAEGDELSTVRFVFNRSADRSADPYSDDCAGEPGPVLATAGDANQTP